MASRIHPIDADIGQLRSRPAAPGQNHPLNTGEDGSKHPVELHIQEQTPLLQQTYENRDYENLHSPDPSLAALNAGVWQSRTKASILWLLPFLLLYMLGFGGVAVPKINLMLSLTCRDYLAKRASTDPGFTYFPVIIGQDNSQCQIPEVQSLVARFQLYFNLVTGLLSALISPQLGHLSDRYGRTSMIALSALGTIVAEAITAIVAANSERVSIYLLLLAATLDGLGGSFTAILALSSSYASDCTISGKRSVAFGYLHGAIFTGVAAGPFLVAILMKKTHNILSVFYSALALHILFFFAAWLLIPESLSEEQKQRAREQYHVKVSLSHQEDLSWLSTKRWNPKKALAPLAILFPPAGRPSTLFPNRGGASTALRRNIILLSVIDTLHLGMALGTAQIIVIYAGYMFGWGNVESSLFVSIISSVRVLNFFIVLPIVCRIFREEQREDLVISGSSALDVVLIRVSILLDTVGFAGYALANSGSFLILSGVVTSLGGMAAPVLQSSLTKHVPRDRIGQILGAKGLLHAISRVVAPSICSFIYSVTVGKFSQTVFVCLSFVFGIAFCGTLYIKAHVQLDINDSSYRNDDTNEYREAVEDENLP
ncbi:putative tetracycline-efflux transporter [Aspergillus alliaceus]|uniref:putative tetracycline-efflux transporter n=1 Tax=Petromyces alliaceus TaxID=209559 RepID=UPI0012A5BC65|nr:major facilitator superfamily domain-containing protein [Aspergillus alliaceus]KAB8235993.1 major facilitator superfamily domain-containing protein [Aspergillus alliaceus]